MNKKDSYSITLILFILSTILCILYQSSVLVILTLLIALIHFQTLPYQHLDVVHLTVKLPVDHPSKIVLLSDFHVSKGKIDVSDRLLRDSVDITYKENPDLVIMLGDYIQRDHKDIALFKSAYEGVTSKFRTIGVIGNHDIRRSDPRDIIECLKSMGITYLENEFYAWNGINFYGTEYYKNETHLNIPSKDNIVLLSHTPSVLNDAYFNDKNDVIMAFFGHTHGSQFRLPVIGDVVSKVPVWTVRFWRRMYLRVLDAKVWKIMFGYKLIHYRTYDLPTYVTSGLGSQYGIRVNCPPDVTVLHVVPSEEVEIDYLK